MTDQVLTVLRFLLLALLYIFFARVLWAVWTEVRTSGSRPGAQGGATPGQVVGPASPTTPTVRPSEPGGKRKRSDAKKSKRGAVTRLVFLEPRARRGTSVLLDGEVTLGRDADCTISIGDDSFVSHRHLRVFDFDGQPMIEDLGSTNGTYHNGNKLIGARLLQRGDRVQVGTIVIEAQ
jgi:predicted component of type VI protein secretion system